MQNAIAKTIQKPRETNGGLEDCISVFQRFRFTSRGFASYSLERATLEVCILMFGHSRSPGLAPATLAASLPIRAAPARGYSDSSFLMNAKNI